MADSSPLIRPFGIAAAILGIIQGVVWTILTFMGALVYLEAWEPYVMKNDPETYGQLLSSVVGSYVNPNLKDLEDDDRYVTPEIFFAWLILYFIISIVWIVISSMQLTAILQNQRGKKMRNIFLAWGVWTSIICACDLILASLLAADYDNFVQDINKIGPSEIIIFGNIGALGIGTMMTLVARGFVLWLVNVIFAVIIVKLGLSATKSPEANMDTSNFGTTNSFGQVITPNKGFNNPSFNWNDERPTLNRNESLSNPYAREGPENLSKLPPISSTSERLAKIGRQGAKSPPQNVAPPKVPQSYIYPSAPRVPSPDYSPPTSPMQLKPALKNRPQNPYGGYNNGRY